MKVHRAVEEGLRPRGQTQQQRQRQQQPNATQRGPGHNNVMPLHIHRLCLPAFPHVRPQYFSSIAAEINDLLQVRGWDAVGMRLAHHRCLVAQAAAAAQAGHTARSPCTHSL